LFTDNDTVTAGGPMFTHCITQAIE